MIDSIDFINNRVNIYCGHDIYTYNINDLYIIRYVGFINNNYSFVYILCVKDEEDKYILSYNQLDIFIQIGVNLSV